MLTLKTDAEKAAYLAAFMDGEGHVGLHRTRVGQWTRHISFCNTDKQLFDTVVGYCRDLGFEPAIAFSRRHKQEWADRWVAYIARDREAFALFARLIPLQAARKRLALKQILESYANPAETQQKKRNGTTRKCESCGSAVYSCRAIQRRGGGRFCSVTCRGVAQRRREVCVCERCNSPFEVPFARRSAARFCSLSCAGKANVPRLASQARDAAKARWGLVKK